MATQMIDIYTVKTTGRVSVTAKRAGDPAMDALKLVSAADAGAADVDDPTLAFTVTGVGPGTIEIGYHVWWDEDGETVPAVEATEEDPAKPATGTKKAKWHSATRKLSVNVVAVD